MSIEFKKLSDVTEKETLSDDAMGLYVDGGEVVKSAASKSSSEETPVYIKVTYDYDAGTTTLNSLTEEDGTSITGLDIRTRIKNGERFKAYYTVFYYYNGEEFEPYNIYGYGPLICIAWGAPELSVPDFAVYCIFDGSGTELTSETWYCFFS